MDQRWLTAGVVVRTLGVSRPTLYAYVSRGLIRSEAGADGRQRRYRREDVDALVDRKANRAATAVAARAMRFGTPILASALTLIACEFHSGNDGAPPAPHRVGLAVGRFE